MIAQTLIFAVLLLIMWTIVILLVWHDAKRPKIIRCQECKYYNTPDCHVCVEEYHVAEGGTGDYYLIDKVVDPNGFCSYGERCDADKD